MTRLSVKKTYKLYIGGAFPRSESGRTYEAEGHNVARASRKDARDAVRAARSAFPGWAGATAYNRGQVLYRLAEMMEARATDLEQRVHRPRRGGRRDRSHGLVRGLDGQARPGARRLEPGRRSLLRLHRSRSRRASSRSLAPAEPPLLGLVSRVLPALAGGNTVVAVASEAHPVAAVELAEAVATSDFPGRGREHPHGLRRRARAVARGPHGRERDRPHGRERPDRRARARGGRERQARRALLAGRAEPVRDRGVPRAQDRLAPDQASSPGSRTPPGAAPPRRGEGEHPHDERTSGSSSAPRCSRRASGPTSFAAWTADAELSAESRRAAPQRVGPAADSTTSVSMPFGPERMKAIATRPRGRVGADRAEGSSSSAAGHACSAADQSSAVRRRRDEHRVPAHARRLAVVPGRPDPPARVDVRRREREGAEALDRAAVVDFGDAHRRRPRRSAVRRARGGDREAACLEEIDRDEIAVGSDRREDAHRRPGADVRAGRPGQAAVVRPADREHVRVGRVGVDEVAAAVEGRRRRVVAGDPVLVEGDTLLAAGAALLGCVERRAPAEAVGGAVDREPRDAVPERERRDEPRRVSRVERDDRDRSPAR